MEYYRLEYNEFQGRFHFNNGGTEPNTHHWITICRSLSLNQCIEFTEFIIKKYPSVNPFNHSVNIIDYPTAELIKQEFIDFLLT